MANEQLQRLQKIIADAGLCSRRDAERLIEDGLVRVNGKIAGLGAKADPSEDSITVRGKTLNKRKEASITIALHKPRGFACTHHDPHEEKTIFDLLPKPFNRQKLIFCGRLDKDSEGLVILTNDGDLCQRITHPSFGVVKRYQVSLHKPLETKLIPKLLKGKNVDGDFLQFMKIAKTRGKVSEEESWEIHLNQGHKREIRRLFEAFGYHVRKLKRTHIGSFPLRGISKGKIAILGKADIAKLEKNPSIA